MGFSCLINLISAKNNKVYLIIEQEKKSQHIRTHRLMYPLSISRHEYRATYLKVS